MGFDSVIRGATLVDGSGADPVEADVAIEDGVVAETGSISGRGREEVDARGLLLTPGFVDIHTHYDGQATWSSELTPSSLHGVTTVVAGNCGVGFAPCRPEDHLKLIRLMEGVEDIPEPVLAKGLEWNWESFEQFLDVLDARRFDIDLATQVPHGALRVYVMGDRGAKREPATPDDVASMAQLAGAAVDAGALGFSTSRTLNHRSSDGSPTPSLDATEDELLGIAQALGRLGKGVLQVVSDFKDRDAEFAMLRRIVSASRRPLSISLAQAGPRPDQWRELLGSIHAATREGLPIKAQVCGRPIGVVLGLEATLNPFSFHPSYREIARLPLPDRVKRLRDPGFRERLLAETPLEGEALGRAMVGAFGNLFALEDPPDYEPLREASLALRAEARGITPAALALELLLEAEGHGLLYFPFLNYAEGSLDACREMMLHEDSVLGLGDGGAHVGTICDASFPTTMLSYWTRDRTRGERLPLPWVVRAHTRETAAAVGLLDRGLVAPGYRADLNLIDYERVRPRRPRIVHDLPAGGRRLMQDADGYVATWVAGEVVYRDGEATGNLPGRLIRGAQPAPTA
jgi:N-acyl-D-aspartate/D-glutamate deacylase